MASLFLVGEIFKVQFAMQGKRRTLSLGRLPKSEAKQQVSLIERLLDLHKRKRAPDTTTVALIEELPTATQRAIQRLGLITSDMQEITLEQLCDHMMERSDSSDSNFKNCGAVKANLLAYFPTFALIRDIGPADADDFRRWLTRTGGRGRNKALAEATVSTRCGVAKRWFSQAVLRKWITSNPFEHHQRGDEANPERFEYISGDVVQQLIDACDEPEFRLVLALARWGGVRVPSEVGKLRWEWVDWAANVIHVRDQKRKRIRHLPIFPEIRRYLEPLHATPVDTPEVLIFNRVSMHKGTLDGRLDTLCRRIGIVRWDKPWQNLRSTRATELTERFPAHVVHAWIGNTPKQGKHYFQVTNDHVDAAVKWSSAASSTPTSNSAAKSAALFCPKLDNSGTK